MKRIIGLFFLLELVSCGNRKIPSYDEVRQQYGNYIINHKKNSLKKSYHTLLRNDDFAKNGLTKKNVNLVIPILIDLQEYDKLITLLNDNKVLSEYHKNFYLNITTALKFRCNDSEKSNFYIHENSKLIEKYITLNSADSTLYVDYYVNKLYSSSLDSVLSEINRIRDKKFTDEFYEHTLKDAVKEYDNQILRCN